MIGAGGISKEGRRRSLGGLQVEGGVRIRAGARGKVEVKVRVTGRVPICFRYGILIIRIGFRLIEW